MCRYMHVFLSSSLPLLLSLYQRVYSQTGMAVCLSSCQIRCTNLRSCRSLLPSHLYKVIHLQTPNPKSSTCNSTSSVGRSLATECQCLSGYTGPGGGPCEPCATGTFKSTIGSAECSLCDEGTYGE